MPAPVTLLLVDDDDSIRRLIARNLEEEGYHVLQAASATHALQIWEAAKHEIALVISDIRMPGTTGDQLASRLTRAPAVPPILFISGYGQEGLWLPGPLLPKPFQLDALSTEVKRLLRGENEAAVA
ncbi:MAG: response regulator [Gemmatimonadales bacterium]